ncbi:hypothetical protein QTP88_005415 [Uroleucon formosanum]
MLPNDGKVIRVFVPCFEGDIYFAQSPSIGARRPLIFYVTFRSRAHPSKLTKKENTDLILGVMTPFLTPTWIICVRYMPLLK